MVARRRARRRRRARAHGARARVGDARRAGADAGAAGGRDLELAAAGDACATAAPLGAGGGGVGARRAWRALAWLFARRPGRARRARAGRAAVPRPGAGGRIDGEPARAALRRDRRRARWRGSSRGWRRATQGDAGASARARWSGCCSAASCSTRCRRSTPTTSTKALEQVVFFYVPFALLFALLRGLRVDAAAAGVGRRRAASALALAFTAIGFWEFQTRQPAAEPEGDRLQPGRGVLPRQLAVLRPEHLRALPGAGDDRAGDACCCGRGAPRDVAGWRSSRSSCSGAGC